MTRVSGSIADSQPGGAWACTVVARIARRPSRPGTQGARREIGMRAAVSGASTSVLRLDCLLVGYAMRKTRAARPAIHRTERWQGNARLRSRMPAGCSGNRRGATQLNSIRKSCCELVARHSGRQQQQCVPRRHRRSTSRSVSISLPPRCHSGGCRGAGAGVATVTPGKPGVSPPTRHTG